MELKLHTRSSPLIPLFIAGGVITLLWAAKDILVPFTLAVLLSFLLGPLVLRLEKFGLSRAFAVVLVTLLSFSVLGGTAWILVSQVRDLAVDLPQYKDNLRDRLRALRPSGTGVIHQLKETADELQQEITGTTEEFPARRGVVGATRSTPLWTQVVEPDPTPAMVIWATVSPLVSPLATAGLVTILVIFMLFQREDLRDRFIRLVGTSQIGLTTTAMDEAASRVSRYLLMQLTINVLYGIPVAVGLTLIGLPNALLWGLLATALRFLPYIGPCIAASMPILVSFAVSRDWSTPLETIGLFIGIELVSNNIVEPLLYGRSTGISALAVIVAAAFWTWIWGPVGLFLSTPLTVCVVVLGKYIPQLEFLNILCGTDPPLPLDVRLYQRLLAADIEEAQQLFTSFLEEKGTCVAFDSLLVPVLVRLESDVQRAIIDSERMKTVHSLVESLASDIPDRSHEDLSPHQIYVLPARTSGDAVAARLFALLAAEKGEKVRVFPTESLVGEMAEEVRVARPQALVVSSLSGVASSRYVLKRLGFGAQEILTLVGIWGGQGEGVFLKNRISESPSVRVVTTFKAALESLLPQFSQAPITKQAI